MSLPVHRIGTYAEHGLPPDMVREFLEGASEVGCEAVVDPFVGSGAAAVEAQERCVDFVGVDANPWSLVLTKAKTTRLDAGYVVESFEGALDIARRLGPLVPSPLLAKYHGPRALEALGVLRRAVELAPAEARPLLLATLAAVAYGHSRLRKMPAPRLVGPGDGDPGSIASEYRALLARNLNDLSSHKFCGSVALVQADSTAWLPRRVCGAITSPPFANNVDYVRHTMLELLWAGLARDSSDLGLLRGAQVPGCEACARTWRGRSADPEVEALLSRVGGRRAEG